VRDDNPNPATALEGYIQERSRWVDARDLAEGLRDVGSFE
jgi:hypothetical protein